MDAGTRTEQRVALAIEQSLADLIAAASVSGSPGRLGQAMRYAVFPGGARLRPRLCLAVAASCGEENIGAALAAAASIELLHCASLVHDDLPCFDDASTRRGKPSVHRAFGERLAVLAGDALIVLAFRALCTSPSAAMPQALLQLIADSVGMPFGIVAGQARECEPHVALDAYHMEKTGALFAAATMAGACSSGEAPQPWRALGERIGLAYQVADDIRDVAAREDEIGKPVGRDHLLGRPSAAAELGVAGAIARLDQLIGAAIEAIPPCRGAAGLKTMIHFEAKRFLPEHLTRCAA